MWNYSVDMQFKLGEPVYCVDEKEYGVVEEFTVRHSYDELSNKFINVIKYTIKNWNNGFIYIVDEKDLRKLD